MSIVAHNRETMAVRVIRLDASQWVKPSDVDQAFKSALGSPESHGNGADAWIDSMLYGGMNEIDAPFRIEIDGTDGMNETTFYYLMLIQCTVGHARLLKSTQTGVDTDVTIAVFG
ncbi:MAG: hypothetical protein KIS68_15995 [Bauldia sp.]|nr:hypothetical protein [Bauldia sp.]